MHEIVIYYYIHLGGGGGDIDIFVHRPSNNRFHKKIIVQNTTYEYSLSSLPPPALIIDAGYATA